MFIYPEVRDLHSQGLEAAKRGDFVGARSFYDAARQELSNASLIQTIDSKVHDARLQRDAAHTFTLQALHNHEIAAFDEAERGLTASAAITQDMLAADSRTQVLSKPYRAELHDEHGATLGVLARLLTAKTVYYDEHTISMPAEPEPRPDYYELAHQEHRQGKNGYYRLRNAVAGAEDAHIRGDSRDRFRWLGRVGTSSIAALARDPGSRRDVWRTLKAHRVRLFSRQASIRAILHDGKA